MSENILRKKDNNEWYRLDLSAVVYPTLQRRSFSSVYRLSALLKEDVKPDVLQKAVDNALPRFPTYKVSMRKGIFWRYLEPNDRPGPFVKEDIKNPCQPMSFKNKSRYLIRVYYYGKHVSLEAHHCLGDGNGGITLFNTILAEYMRLLGHNIPVGGTVLDINEKPHPEELEDAYMRYANAKVKPSRPGDKCYLIHGTPEPFYTLNMIIGIIPCDELSRVAKSYQASVTEYLNSVLLYALLQKQYHDKPRKLLPVVLAMPVNLRRFFPTKTLRNFITMIYPTIDPRLGDYTFQEIITQVHHYMRYYINDKFLRGDITTNAGTKNHPIIRIVPLFIKDLVVKQFYKSVQDSSSSAGITNMGLLKLSDEMSEHIERYNICMGQPYSNKTNCSIISYGNTTTVTFASAIKESDVEMYFFRKLIKDGIHVKLETNRE